MANASVLIVDGDAAFTTAAQRALEGEGVQVIVTDDPSLAMVRKMRPHAMIVNVELPRSSGFSLCSRVRRDKILANTPILLTGNEVTDDAFARHAKTGDRADDYAKKPIDEADVVSRVNKLIADGAERRGEGEEPAAVPTGDLTLGADDDEGAPPPLPPAASEPWKAQSFDEMVRERVDVAEPPSVRTATQDERITMLRQRVKFLDSQLRSARQGWDIVQAQTRNLAREHSAWSTELTKAKSELAKLKNALLVEHTKYKTFNQEVERIFREKEDEEAASNKKLKALTEEVAVHRRDLAVGKQQIEHDAQRLAIFQEELGSFQTDNDTLHAGLEAAREGLESVTHELGAAKERNAELSARLETTETIATERAEQIEKLTERIDDLVLKASTEKKQAAAEHAQATDRLITEHAAAIEKLEAEQTAAMDGAVASYETQLAELEHANATDIEALTTEHADALAEQAAKNADALAEQAERDADALTKQAEQNAEAQSVLQRALDAGATSAQEFEEKADALSAQLDAIEAEKADADTELVRLGEALAAAKSAHQQTAAQYEEEITELEDGHRSAMESASQQIAKGKEALSSTSAEHDDAVAQLVADHEAALEGLQRDLDDRMAGAAIEHDDALSTLTAAHETKLEEVSAARSRAHAEYESALQELEERQESDRREWVARLEAAEERHGNVNAEADELRERLEAQVRELDEAGRAQAEQLAALGAEKANETERADEAAATVDEMQASLTSQAERIEALQS